MKRTAMIGHLTPAHAGQTVTLQGWVNRRRDLGGLIFLELRDRSGLVQVQVEPDSAAFADADRLRAEYVAEIEGTYQTRPDSQRKGGLADYEVIATRVKVLNTAKTTPFELEKGDSVAEDIRLKFRYLDLRRPEMQRNLVLRSKAVAAVTEYLDREGFVQVETPMLTKSTPEGARDFLVPSRQNPGEFYALPQSPQLFKQMLMVAGYDRYYQLARCFRDEDLRADRQPDFTQLDMEMSFVELDDVLSTQEGLMAHVFRETMGVDLAVPFPRMAYMDAMNLYGSDKPDLRFDLKFTDVTDLFQGGEFKAFAAAQAVKVIAAPELTRKQIDELERIAKQNGAGGLAWLKRDGDGFTGGISKFVTAQAAELIARTGVAQGGTLLFTAGEWKKAVGALGAVRLALRDLFNLAAAGPQFHVSWVTEFPQLEFDDESSTWTYMHHPFTAPHPDDLDLFGTDRQGEIRAQAYDLVLNGFEVGGGSIRIHDPAVQAKMFQAIGFSAEQARDKFGFFMDALEYGTPPHGGIAWGFDRLIMVMSGATSIREVIAFPKNNRGVDLMALAPSPVEPGQLADVGLSVANSED
ncbi:MULTISPECIES: aspartate--tRNA ligase [Deinococcus]|uniref:Aspartyl-tRNA synthetase n=2 Tax=Deinococcus soli (ex Cha et al. 2016) TaxID=1309411 RepID=A0ACC6KDH5_9DEIO|nr:MULTISPECIES: aspartate--tRNA ligase [Deinococcus]MDK2011194.1 aspartate--tRNA ligase [Deinococcus sp. 43]MDR6217375.1 aspartyl-tRNA synthetase [Deinococcus soli (ex Cha et al. 2016)]MDR6326684.1 aspartyl-tRNA synthetase [Deinococcus soli (ex Cha et al. 2016)]MDR6750589.1 aspartyl-tRNA synthetase [Deinococcus soli (ex Cha et al. 2016)]GGB56592.1 aspartate--tRNA(Asp) ligase [Deinococcus soli (ex Cha et al. 2016)]